MLFHKVQRLSTSPADVVLRHSTTQQEPISGDTIFSYHSQHSIVRLGWSMGPSVSLVFHPLRNGLPNIAINCKAANNAVLGSATITSAPFVRNRVSEYTGPLFGDSGAMTLSLTRHGMTAIQAHGK